MLYHCKLEETCLYISKTDKTIIKFNDEIEFTLVPKHLKNKEYIIQVEDIKGDFEINKISIHRYDRFNCRHNIIEVKYDTENKTFIIDDEIDSNGFFYISANLELKKVSFVDVTYELNISHARMNALNVGECYEDKIVLPGYNYLSFPLNVGKVKNGVICVIIKNPYNIKINGKNGDFTTQFYLKQDDFKTKLVFIFDPASLEGNIPMNEIENGTQSESRTTRASLYEILTKSAFKDAILISSDNIQIPTHRCILAHYSDIFKSIFAEKHVVPVKIQIEGFDANTISAALEFCYGKNNSIFGNENKVFEFATKYGIDVLKFACCSEANVTPGNVCEMIQISYSGELEILKLKCHQILKDHREEVDSSKLRQLPAHILADILLTI